jgi:hypothetical protein
MPEATIAAVLRRATLSPAKLIVQRVLNGDNRLCREVRDQGNLPVGEGTEFLPIDRESADQFIVLEHRHIDRR